MKTTLLKTIGLIGGTSWPSTIEFYKILNQMAGEKYGAGHSARILLSSIDYFEISKHYPNNWEMINPILKRELEYLDSVNPSCIALCNNTLHEGIDMIKSDLSLKPPFIHMVDEVVSYLSQRKFNSVLLTGTKYTMECGYYKNKLESSGLKVVIPESAHRNLIQDIQKIIASGVSVNSSHLTKIRQMLETYKNCDVVLAACTELPLVINDQSSPIEVADPAEILCQKLFQYNDGGLSK